MFLSSLPRTVPSGKLRSLQGKWWEEGREKGASDLVMALCVVSGAGLVSFAHL
jgi:hypothetical protein